MDLITSPATVGYSPPSTSVVHNAAVSLTERAPASIVHLVQYDTTIPIVAVELTANGQPYTVPGGAAVNVRMKKPDGHFIYDPALGLSDDSQTAYIGVTLQMTAAFGKSTPIIEIVVDGNVAATGTFMLDIDENQVPESAIESTDEYLTIYQILQQVQAAAKIVSDNEEGIQYIADNQENISAVVANGENITAVGQSIDNVNAVGTNIADVQTAAQNIEAIKDAPAAAENAAASATLSESWAVGSTGTREGEDTNNSKYWAEKSAESASGFLGVFDTPEALTSAYPTGTPGQIAVVLSTLSVWLWSSTAAAWVDTAAHLYKATLLLDGWTGDVAPYTQTVTLEPMDGGGPVSTSSTLHSGPMADSTGNADTNAVVIAGLNRINNAQSITLGDNTVTVQVPRKPVSDVPVVFSIKGGV